MIKKKLSKLVKDYYTDLYKNQLGLDNYKWRVKNRVNEDDEKSYYTANRYITKIEALISFELKNKKVLSVGAGTGGEMVQFTKKGCQVYGVEPDEKALEILKLKAALGKMDKKKIIKATAENLPFSNNFFDLVYCWQVIEHVGDVEKSIKEMIRVTKKDGYIFIGCPDYRQIVEPHYKIYLPLFLSKWIVRILIKLRGRKLDFFNSLQFVTAKKIRNILRNNGVTAMQIINPYSQSELKMRDWRKLMFWIQDHLEIEQDQYWLIKKI